DELRTPVLRLEQPATDGLRPDHHIGNLTRVGEFEKPAVRNLRRFPPGRDQPLDQQNHHDGDEEIPEVELRLLFHLVFPAPPAPPASCRSAARLPMGTGSMAAP